MVVIILGSKADYLWGNGIAEDLRKFGIKYEIRIGSAHKTPEYLLSVLEEYERKKTADIYICVAGRSNALGGFIDAHTDKPVINCPPYNEKYAGMDVLSSLRMPSQIAPLTVLEPDQAALACAKIIGLSDKTMAKRVNEMHIIMRKKIIEENR